MSSSFESLNSVSTSLKNVLPGATQAFFVDVQAGQQRLVIKNIGNTGGLEILQCSSGASLPSGGSQLYTTPNFIAGSTLTAAQLVALSGTGYLMSANEVMSLAGAVRLYLNAPSATCTVAILKGLSSGV